MDRLESPSTADAAPESFNIYTMDTLNNYAKKPTTNVQQKNQYPSNLTYDQLSSIIKKSKLSPSFRYAIQPVNALSADLLQIYILCWLYLKIEFLHLCTWLREMPLL